MDPGEPINITKMKLLLWNANGIRNKTHYLEHLLVTHKPVILALTETKLDSSVASSELCSGYTIYRADRQATKGLGGGVLIGILNEFPIKVTNISTHPTAELISLQLNYLGFSFVFGCYYRPPSIRNIDSLIDWVECQTNPNIIVAGDFNLPDISWPDYITKTGRDPTVHRDFLELLQTNNFMQPISFPTHNLGNTLDIVMTSLDLVDVEGEPSISDHHSIVGKVCLPVMRSGSSLCSGPPKKFWDFKKASLSNIIVDCKSVSRQVSSMIAQADTVENVWNVFKKSLVSLAERSIPNYSRKIRNKHWIRHTTIRSIRKRNRLFRTYTRYPTNENRDALVSASKLCKSLINGDYKAFVNKHICNELEDGNSKPLFSFIAGKKNERGSIKTLDGSKSDSSKDIAECFATAFTSVFTLDNGKMPVLDNTRTFASGTDQLVITADGVKKLLLDLDPRKGHGPDGLTPALLRFLAPYIDCLIAQLATYSLSTGQVPMDWKTANVVPIYKQKGSRSSPLNYRPISLTSIISKLVEHIISHDIHEHLRVNDILQDCQHGFRAKRGCESQLLTTVSNLVNNFDDDRQSDLIVLDFAKAFDVVSHTKLVYKLKYYCIRPQVVDWISNWLKGRIQHVTVDGAMSVSHQVTSGVPQGSVLGPLLFLLYINDMPDCVQYSNLRLFADDSLVYNTVQSTSDSKNLQEDLNRLIKWAEDWQMRFNAGKCESMTIARTHRLSCQYSVSSGKALDKTESFKYLGMTIDDGLSFEVHIENITKKATGVLYMLMRSLKRANPHTKRVAYFTICRPILEFSSIVWSPYQKKSIGKIEAINRRAFRWAYGFTKYSRITDEMGNRDWPTLLERRNSADLKFRDKIIAEEVAVPVETLYSHYPSLHNTRHGATVGRVNTNVKNNFYYNRVHRYTCTKR